MRMPRCCIKLSPVFVFAASGKAGRRFQCWVVFDRRRSKEEVNGRRLEDEEDGRREIREGGYRKFRMVRVDDRPRVKGTGSYKLSWEQFVLGVEGKWVMMA